MDDLAQLFAACLVEYARRETGGVLTGPFYTFGKDARDAFNLPYDEKLFRDAFAALRQIGALTEYKHDKIQTYYRLSAPSFDDGMQQDMRGVRKHQTGGNAANSATAATYISSFDRSPSLLESYADLGSDYLIEMLETYEPMLTAVGSDETEESLVLGVSLPIPASDRVVTISHNQQANIDPPLANLIDDVRSDNEELPDGVKERLLGQLRAGQELVRSGSVRAYLLYHTLIRGLMELVARYRGRAIAVAAERLIELLVEHILQAAA